ncbi:MAG: hypothetical protein AAFQ98_15615, partial [Bacteroidota bacterium]
MNFNALSEIVQRQKSGTRFQLIASDYESHAISYLFQRWHPAAKWVIKQATLSSTDSSITVSGVLATRFLSQKNLRVMAVFTLVEEVAQVRFTLDGFPEGWKMEDAFSATQGSITNQFKFFVPTFHLDSQKPDALDENFQTEFGYLSNRPVTAEQLKQGLSFEASLYLRDLPESLRWFFAGDTREKLALSGSITVTKNRPIYWLQTEPVNFTLLGREFPIQLMWLRYVKTKSNGTETTTEVAQIQTSLTLGEEEDTKELTLRAQFTALDFYALTLEARMEQGAILTLPDLAEFLGQEKLADFLPDDLPVLDALGFRKLGMELVPSQAQVLSLYAWVGFDEPWSLFGDLFQMEDLTFIFVVSNPLQASLLQLGITMYAEMRLGGQPFQVSMDLLTTQFTARSLAGAKVNLTHLLTGFLELSFDLPNLEATNMYLNALPRAGYFDFSTTLESDWELRLGGKESLKIQGLTLEATYQSKTDYSPTEVQASLFGSLLIGQAQLMLRAAYNSVGNSWSFQGETVGNSEIGLIPTVNTLMQAFGTSLPDALPNITLRNLSASFSTGTGDYSFMGECTVPGKFPLGAKEFELDMRANIQSTVEATTGKRSATGFMEAYLEVGDMEWLLRYEMAEKASKVEATWRSLDEEGLGLDTLLDTLGLGAAEGVPKDLNIGLAVISIEYDVAHQYLTLSGGTTEGWDAYLTASKASGQWVFVFGMSMQVEGGKLSSLPVIGKDLEMADFISVEAAGILLASGDIDGYEPPPLPALPAVEDGMGTPLPPVQPLNANTTLQVTRGFSVMASVDLAPQASKNKPLSLVLDTLEESQLVFQITYDVNQVSYYASLSGGISLPNRRSADFSLNQASLRFQQTVLGQVYQVMGGFSFSLFGETLTVTGAGIFETDGVAMALNVMADGDGISGPPGLKGLRLQQLGLLMGVEYTPPSVTLALQGQFTIGVGQS